MNDSGAHVVVAMRRSVRMFVLFEHDRICLDRRLRTLRREGVRLGDFVDEFQIAAAIDHREKLPCAVGPHGFNRQRSRRQQRGPVFGAQPEPWRHAVLEYFEDDDTVRGRDAVRLVMVMAIECVTVTVAVMVLAAAEQPGAGDVDRQAETGNRNCLGELDRHRREDAADAPRSRSAARSSPG